MPRLFSSERAQKYQYMALSVYSPAWKAEKREIQASVFNCKCVTVERVYLVYL